MFFSHVKPKLLNQCLSYRNARLFNQLANFSQLRTGIVGCSRPANLLSPGKVMLGECRYVRSRNPDDNKERSDTFDSESNKSDNKEEQKKIDPALIKKLRIYVLIVAGLSFVSSFLLLSQMSKSAVNVTDGLTDQDFTKKTIKLNDFINHYLNSGEVKRIVFSPANSRAIAILHPGAVINGQPVRESTVAIEYHQNAQQFFADIRKAEGELGIGISQGIPIDMHQGMTTFRMVELLIGIGILIFLGTQYGRLLRKRLAEKAKNQKSK